MSEIYIATKLTHPAERVWRALTNRELLTRWLAGTKVSPLADSSFLLQLANLPGLGVPINVEVVELDPPRTLVMRWQQEQLQTLVTAELAPDPEGCQLIFRESPEAGDWQLEQRELREQSYQRVFTLQLPAALDWVAFREQNLRADITAELPPIVDQSHARRRTHRLAAAVAAALLGGAGILAVMLLAGNPTAKDGFSADGGAVSTATTPTATTGPATPGDKRPTSSQRPTPTITPSQTPSVRTASATATKPPSEPGRPPIDAEYQTVQSGLSSYTGKVILRNSGKAAAAHWVVTVTLSGSATVERASGARFEQKDQTVTFTGNPVAPNGSASFQFDVTVGLFADKKPANCTIDGRPCTGL